MPRLRLPLTTILLASVAHAADHKPAPAKHAAEYAAFDTHVNEHVTIAAEPCDDPKDCAFFRLNYLAHGMLPVRVVITNDGDRALSLDDARIQLISSNRDTLTAATDEDLNRRLFNTRNTRDTQIPLIVVPLSIPIHHKPIDKKITEDGADFGFQGTVVNAHSTLAGFLFYDIKQLDDPALRHAELYLKQIHTLDGKHELFAFTIPFDKWLAANPNAPSNQVRR